jgi:hypothetical protein
MHRPHTALVPDRGSWRPMLGGMSGSSNPNCRAIDVSEVSKRASQTAAFLHSEAPSSPKVFRVFSQI